MAPQAARAWYPMTPCRIVLLKLLLWTLGIDQRSLKKHSLETVEREESFTGNLSCEHPQGTVVVKDPSLGTVASENLLSGNRGYEHSLATVVLVTWEPWHGKEQSFPKLKSSTDPNLPAHWAMPANLLLLGSIRVPAGAGPVAPPEHS